MGAQRNIAVIGGGAAGFFAAIRCAELDPSAVVAIFEATRHPLAKVRVSGGGRCNVTHACFDARELGRRFPRGERELIGPFHKFGPRDTIAWFAARGVELKTEPDGRMFPITDDSATIVSALCDAATRARVQLRLACGVTAITRTGDGTFLLSLASGGTDTAACVLLATGGNKGAAGPGMAAAFGHSIEPLVPSLFTFHIDDPRLRGLEGLAVPEAGASVPDTRLRETGPILITHWGLSGPAILRLSAWGARELHAMDYRFTVLVNWVAPRNTTQTVAELASLRTQHPRKHIASINPFGVPARLWERLVAATSIKPEATWAGLSSAAAGELAAQLTAAAFSVTGKSMNKEEFVTCGGVRLREVDFRTMQSRLCPGLFFAGELLDLDGITGGFNFQAAWTTGWLAGTAMAGLPAA